jgi:hypothetical protein
MNRRGKLIAARPDFAEWLNVIADFAFINSLDALKDRFWDLTMPHIYRTESIHRSGDLEINYQGLSLDFKLPGDRCNSRELAILQTPLTPIRGREGSRPQVSG